MENKNLPIEYQQVQPAEAHFAGLAGQEEPELFNILLNRIYANLLKFAENVIGIRLYARIEEPLLAGLSSRVKRLASIFIEKKLIKKIAKTLRFYPDEPWLTQYLAETPSTPSDLAAYSDGMGSIANLSGGIDFNEEGAFIKTVGEALERLCLCVYRERNFTLSPYDKVSKTVLNPLSFAGISPSLRKANPRLKIDEKSVFRWVRGFSLFDSRKIFIPAQLVYVGYKYAEGEPIIQEQISTGAAAADSFAGALYGGICEAVERDAFMINYLNKLSPPLIDLGTVKNEKFQKLLAMFRRYNLELYVVNITTDISIPSMAAIIIDRTGAGPFVHVGAKTDLEIEKAVIGAVCEALRGRLGFRHKFPLSDDLKKKQEFIKTNPSRIMTFEDRFLFWDSLDMIKEIEFLFQGQEKKLNAEDLQRYKDFSGKEKLKKSLEILKKAKIDIYGVDITMPQIKEEGIYVAKVVSPQFQPLYLQEWLKHSWGERLFNVPVKLGYRDKPLSENELNSFPHPFL